MQTPRRQGTRENSNAHLGTTDVLSIRPILRRSSIAAYGPTLMAFPRSPGWTTYHKLQPNND